MVDAEGDISSHTWYTNPWFIFQVNSPTLLYAKTSFMYILPSSTKDLK